VRSSLCWLRTLRKCVFCVVCVREGFSDEIRGRVFTIHYLIEVILEVISNRIADTGKFLY
jgi:hypothetical protein